jgi:hypothetical protein
LATLAFAAASPFLDEGAGGIPTDNGFSRQGDWSFAGERTSCPETPLHLHARLPFDRCLLGQSASPFSHEDYSRNARLGRLATLTTHSSQHGSTARTLQ